MLTHDDRGGYDDHSSPPAVEYMPDNVQLSFGPRVPLIMFGGRVRTGIDHRWCSHVSVVETAMQVLGLPALGVARAAPADSAARSRPATPRRRARLCASIALGVVSAELLDQSHRERP